MKFLNKLHQATHTHTHTYNNEVKLIFVLTTLHLQTTSKKCKHTHTHSHFSESKTLAHTHTQVIASRGNALFGGRFFFGSFIERQDKLLLWEFEFSLWVLFISVLSDLFVASEISRIYNRLIEVGKRKRYYLRLWVILLYKRYVLSTHYGYQLDGKDKGMLEW